MVGIPAVRLGLSCKQPTHPVTASACARGHCHTKVLFGGNGTSSVRFENFTAFTVLPDRSWKGQCHRPRCLATSLRSRAFGWASLFERAEWPPLVSPPVWHLLVASLRQVQQGAVVLSGLFEEAKCAPGRGCQVSFRMGSRSLPYSSRQLSYLFRRRAP